MSISDYKRPADYQVTVHYECASCGATTEVESCYSPCDCSCGGAFNMTGESYPADAEEWHEERDNINDDYLNVYR